MPPLRSADEPLTGENSATLRVLTVHILRTQLPHMRWVRKPALRPWSRGGTHHAGILQLALGPRTTALRPRLPCRRDILESSQRLLLLLLVRRLLLPAHPIAELLVD